MNGRILIVEDDKDIAQNVEDFLTSYGFQIVCTGTGDEGFELSSSGEFDLMLLDLMLPGMSGIEICRLLRERQYKLPVLVVSAKSEVHSRVLALEVGADDYIIKPFHLEELLARVHALLRRVRLQNANEEGRLREDYIEYPGLKVDTRRQKVIVRGKPCLLTRTEFLLLQLLIKTPGQVFTREQLLSDVWGYEFDGYDHTVNSHVNRLRSKIEVDPRRPEYIRTVWGTGYRFAEKNELTDFDAGRDFL